MSERTPESASAPLSLPDVPNLAWLRKESKRRLADLRRGRADARLADAQLELARQYGFPSWRALKAHVDSLTVDGQLFDAAKKGDVERLARLLDVHPEKLRVRNKPYEWTLLHAAAAEGQLPAVNLLIDRGLDVNSRERGDNTYPMHWAAAAGRLDVVQRLADAGGDVIGRGDDHELEVIGWATCWEGCDDAAHRAVAEFLVSRGAPHHIFSAIAMNRPGVVRRIVAGEPAALNRRMSRNEDHQLPLHFAVRMKRPEMVALLVQLGADPLAVDGSGYPAAIYATTPAMDRPAMEAIRGMTAGELLSAARGGRQPRVRMMDLIAVLALGDWVTADRLLNGSPNALERGGPGAGVLHVMCKRGDVTAVRWLIDHGADVNARWAHWDADVTPLHLATLGDHPEVVRLLLAAGADPTIRDSQHDSDARGWAEFFGHREIVRILSST